MNKHAEHLLMKLSKDFDYKKNTTSKGTINAHMYLGWYRHYLEPL